MSSCRRGADIGSEIPSAIARTALPCKEVGVVKVYNTAINEAVSEVFGYVLLLA